MNEHSGQVLLINWVRANEAQYPELRLLFAIPNGGARDKATGFRLKAEGVLAGVPDLFFPVARNGRHGLFIEMKAVKGRPSQKQIDFIRELRGQQYTAEICYSHQEAIQLIKDYLGIDNDKPWQQTIGK